MSLPFTTVQAEFNSDQPTPCCSHPHPLEGVDFEHVPISRSVAWGRPPNRANLFFRGSDHPRLNHPPACPTPFRTSAVRGLSVRAKCEKTPGGIPVVSKKTPQPRNSTSDDCNPCRKGGHPLAPLHAPGGVGSPPMSALGKKDMAEAIPKF